MAFNDFRPYIIMYRLDDEKSSLDRSKSQNVVIYENFDFKHDLDDIEKMENAKHLAD